MKEKLKKKLNYILLNKVAFSALLLGVSLITPRLYAQHLSGNNLMEFQYGNIPDTDPSDLNTLYNQTNLNYRYKKISVKLRLEQFYNSEDRNRNYVDLSQYSLKYREKGFKLALGTLYETLGRGLLLRTYEIKNSILEDRIYRVKTGFYRDLQGVSTSYRGKIGQVKILGGMPLNNIYPPGDSLSRQDFLVGTESYLRIKQHKIGGILLRNNAPAETATYASLFAEGSVIKQLSYYAEYAKTIAYHNSLTNSTENNGHGLYIGFSYTFEHSGVSLEVKDYQNFFLGTGFSAPPTLVKEHTYKVLNRSTHVSDLINEKGVQAEFFHNFTSNDFVTINFSQTVNNQFSRKEFYEIFVEYGLSRHQNFKAKFFIDYSKDDLYLEDNRVALGAYLDKNLDKTTITWNAEIQNITRVFAQKIDIWNAYSGITVNFNSKLHLSAFWEFTNDPNLTDRKGTPEIEELRHYFGGQVMYEITDSNKISLFAGQRRGGPACSSGICYEVLDFEGLELRLTSRF